MSAHILDITQERSHNPNDPHCGHGYIARLCARFLTHQFGDFPAPSATVRPLDQFIGYILYRTKYPYSVTFNALYLLGLLKARFSNRVTPNHALSVYHLFITAFIVSSKTLSDNSYSNKSFASLVSTVTDITKINEMEREMLLYLDWKVNVGPEDLDGFRTAVERDFTRDGPYPTYRYSMPVGEPVKVPASLLSDSSDPTLWVTRNASPSEFMPTECTVSRSPRLRKASSQMLSSASASVPVAQHTYPPAPLPIIHRHGAPQPHRAATIPIVAYPIVAPPRSQRNATKQIYSYPPVQATGYPTGMSHASVEAAKAQARAGVGTGVRSGTGAAPAIYRR